MAEAESPSLGPLRAQVMDASLTGLRLRVPGSRDALGDVTGRSLDRLTVVCEDEVVYRGAATVVRQQTLGDEVDLGLRLEQGSIDLRRIRLAAFRREVNQRWLDTVATPRTPQVSAEFRAWVADFTTFLTLACAFADQEERALSGLDAGSLAESHHALLQYIAPQVIERMQAAHVELAALVSGLSEERHRAHRAYLQLHVGPYLRRAPFLQRAFQKPLGYAGDYEMMNMLYREHAEGDSVFGRAMNLYATSSPVARANINRIEYFGQRITEVVSRHPARRVRVVSVGCGPAFEVLNFLRSRPELGSRLDVVLIDQEPNAVAHCERTLAGPAQDVGAEVHVVQEGIRRLISTRHAQGVLGECDLIYSAGLFDYLGDRMFGTLLASLYNCVATDGTLIVGNVASDNPDRWAMEYFTEWFLHHRAPADLLALAAGLSPTPASATVDSEGTGVNLFLTVRR